MKETITIFVFCLATQFIYAQERILEDNTTSLDSNLNKFAGTWRSVNGTDTITILFKKILFPYDSYTNCFYETIVGHHEYKKGNTIVESSMALQNSAPNEYKFTLTSDNYRGTNGQIDYNKLTFSLYDISKDRKHLRVFMTINSARNQLTWLLRGGDNMHRKNIARGSTFPDNLVFNKVP